MEDAAGQFFQITALHLPYICLTSAIQPYIYLALRDFVAQPSTRASIKEIWSNQGKWTLRVERTFVHHSPGLDYMYLSNTAESPPHRAKGPPPAA